jgi:hypothetical protein
LFIYEGSQILRELLLNRRDVEVSKEEKGRQEGSIRQRKLGDF